MIEFTQDKDKLTCTFLGKLDTGSIPQIEKDLAQKTGGAPGVVVFDLKGVDYVSSSFLRICLKMAKERGEGGFSIVNVSPTVQKVFKIAGFDKIMAIA